MAENATVPAAGAGPVAGQGAAPGPSTVPATAAETSPDNPWPLQLLSQKLKIHIERAPAAWVEGQVIELNRRGGSAFLTLRDVDAEISLPASIWSKCAGPPGDAARTRKPGGGPAQGRVLAEDRAPEHVREGHPARWVWAISSPGSNGCAMPWPRKDCSPNRRKKRLPLLPHRIGLITGRDSDAKKDVLRNAALRWPAVEFEIREVAVQGNTAVSQMVEALRELDARPEVDVIVIARGGGALEDLLPFSSEELIRAVAAAVTPVVSAIGHEADRPILDDVADLRASTPTDAAKRIVPEVVGGTCPGPPGRGPAAPLRDHAGGPGNRPPGRAALPPRPGGPGRHGHGAARTTWNGSSAGPRPPSAPPSRGPPTNWCHLQAQVRALSPQQTLDRGYAVVQLSGTAGPSCPPAVPGPCGNGALGPRGRRAVRRRIHRRTRSRDA